LQAVENVETVIAPELEGMDAMNQRLIDQTMIALDGTANKSKLGANAILAVSLACARATAQTLEVRSTAIWRRQRQHPAHPYAQRAQRRAHADSNVDFQEFMIMPVGAERFSDALRWAAETFHTLKGVLKKKGYNTAVGDEGGFAPSLKSNAEAIELILEAIEAAGYKPGEQIAIALDPASSEFYDKDKKKYVFKKGDKSELSSEEMVHSTTTGCASTPSSRSKTAWPKKIGKAGRSHRQAGSKIQLVGDDIFCTNIKLLQRGIEEGVGNSILIKLNQIGTITETLEAIDLAPLRLHLGHFAPQRRNRRHLHRDLAVATGVGQIKTGSVSRTDRIAKYNQLLRIEEELGSGAVYLGLES